MNWASINFDWNQVRAFLATAEEGSLSAAARALGQTQPTLSRQISALEEALGVTLFERGRRATRLTETGSDLLEHVRVMGDAAQHISLLASGQSERISGRVSITATNVMLTHHLADTIAHIRAIAPEVQLDLIASDSVLDLTKREADIAIRHARPTQEALVARLIREFKAFIYTSPAYVERHGIPETIADLERHQFIGTDQMDRMLPVLREFGLPLGPENFMLRTGSGTTIVELARRGLGMTIFTEDMQQLAPDLYPVLTNDFHVPVPIWLVTHRELHTSKRIRLVFDALADGLKVASLAYTREIIPRVVWE